MSLSTVIPIPKGRNCSLVDSTNYPGIALSYICSKLLDLIALSRYSDKLLTSDLQFCFKAKRSTSMCTMVLKEVISYYVNNDSSVYCTLLGATKAFDRVEYCKLFRVLLNRKLPAACIRLLANMHTRRVTRVS